MVAARPEKATARAHLAAAAVAVAVTVLMTWPLARYAGDHMLEAIYYWDAYTNTMILGCRVDAMFGLGPLSFYDNYFFAPVPNTIVFNENLFGLTPIFAPFYLVSQNPLLAYNATLLISLALSVFFTYLLVRRLTGSGYAGVVAGVAFAFSPYVTFEMARLQLVCTQWIPACFLMLHRAVERKRLADAAGFWLSYLLQIGTCLYYAMFLLPLLALAGVMLLSRQRPAREFYVRFAALGVLAAVVALGMVYPYLAAREAFSLERSLSFASSYDGKLGFFANVHETNLTLTPLHHLANPKGAHEEIAFPGFTVLAMALLALGVPLRQFFEKVGLRSGAAALGRWGATLGLGLIASILAHTLLLGAMVFGVGVWLEVRRKGPRPFAGQSGLYLAMLSLSVVLFLGIAPMQWSGEPVHGLYYYLYAYFPGFDGIRKVSRWAVMTTFAFAIVASFGSAWLFSKLSRPRAKVLAVSLLLTATCFELRVFPHPVKEVWTASTLPDAYRFLASLPSEDLVAFVPQDDGVRRFRYDAGMMLHNYLTLYHKHRSLNGESSWVPPVTELVLRMLSHLTERGAWRVLEAVGGRHLMIDAEDLPPERRDLPDRLAAQSERYRLEYQKGPYSVFSLVESKDPTLALLDMPALPAGAKRVPHFELRARADLRPESARLATDDDPLTFWTGSRPQVHGQYFEIDLGKPRRVVALEIKNPQHVMDVPMSFELSVALGKTGLRTLVRQSKLRVYREQVFSPKTFVFRVVLPKPTRADRIRIAIAQALPGHYLTIHEAYVYEQGS